MRGVGGPLLCIGDLLSDVGDDQEVIDGWAHQGEDADTRTACSSPSSTPTAVGAVSREDPLHPSDLHQLFQDNYNELIKSLEGNDHSWTASTLKLCAALKMANKLVTSANSNVESLLEKIEVLEKILKRGESAVATAKTISSMQTTK